ncbi:MAG: flagellar biosynthesis anti-sigma factor FlgM [Actinobacteria bacterium]|nr:flagellar biosynthesis anti-sigma factor FlgM [Actinomycetota bacterium]
MTAPRPVHDPLPLPVTAADRRRRADRVAEIGRRVAAGRYRVPAEEVAEAIVAFHRREERR